MSLFEGRQLLLPPGFLNDATTTALLQNKTPISDGGGKNSFRISDLLEKQDEEAVSPLRGSPSEVEIFSHESSSEEHTTSSERKIRKSRTIFSNKQIKELERTFEKQKYLSVQDRRELASKMGLSDTQVKTWYQNRRTKWKRETSSDLMAETFPSILQPLWFSPVPPLPLLALLRSPFFPSLRSHL